MTRERIGLVLGLALLVGIAVFPIPGIPDEARRMLAVAAIMATWWVTEAAPLAVTSLLPLVLLPVLGITNAAGAAAPYANHLVYLFLGGFMIAQAMQRWNLHRRFALRIVMAMGSSPPRLVLGFMVASAFLSMWVSNTATTAMMMPIGDGGGRGDLARGTRRAAPRARGVPLRGVPDARLRLRRVHWGIRNPDRDPSQRVPRRLPRGRDWASRSPSCVGSLSRCR